MCVCVRVLLSGADAAVPQQAGGSERERVSLGFGSDDEDDDDDFE